MLIQGKKYGLQTSSWQPGLRSKTEKSRILFPMAAGADVDYEDLRIVPGFLDIHCHGAYGFDTNDANEDGLRKWTKI